MHHQQIFDRDIEVDENRFQILFDESEEYGPVAGLGILGGKVVRFPNGSSELGSDIPMKIPHGFLMVSGFSSWGYARVIFMDSDENSYEKYIGQFL